MHEDERPWPIPAKVAVDEIEVPYIPNRAERRRRAKIIRSATKAAHRAEVARLEADMDEKSRAQAHVMAEEMMRAELRRK